MRAHWAWAPFPIRSSTMAQPSPIIVLVCPKCGRKYSGDPSKLTGKPLCKDDDTPLVLPENDAGATMAMGMDTMTPAAGGQSADGATLEFTSATMAPTSPTMTPTVGPKTYQERPSVLSILGSGTPGASTPANDVRKYAISGKLGQGGVGEVLLVEDR